MYGNFGTSLSTPCWAGLIAIADQGRVARGSTTLGSVADPAQTLQALYSLPAGDYHDITTGYNGYAASAGYDEVTGLGTPIANRLIPGLVAYRSPTRS
jgi:subtilase family serine protease